MAEKIQNYCPLLQKKCIGDKCQAWVEDMIENTQTKSTTMRGDCSIFFWNTIYLRAIAHRTDAAQIHLERLRNNEETGVQLLTAAIATASDQRRLGGNGVD